MREHTEYAIDWGDEIDDGYQSAEDAQAAIDDSRLYYAQQGFDPTPIDGGKVVMRTVTITTSEWGPVPSRGSLDPEPYRCDEKPGLRHDRETVYLCHDPVFEPRPDYEQAATAYLPTPSGSRDD